MERQKALLKRILIDPVKSNIAAVFFWGGLLAVFVGAIFGDALDDFSLIPDGSGKALLNIGSAVLGAGVFAVIMKSVQFTEVFQKHIFDVFHKPENAISGIEIKTKWRDLTNALLREVLPQTYLEAASKIEQQYFNAELEYHFEDYETSYEIVIDKTSNVATIESYSRSTVVLSPHVKDPVLKQALVADGPVQLKALRMNDKDLLSETGFVVDPANSKRRELSFPLNQFAVENAKGVRVARFEKVTLWAQDLSVDPFISAEISRYIKGSYIRAKITPGYKVIFEKFGVGELPDGYHTKDAGEGFERWRLVGPDDLLLPGQAYILMIVPIPDVEK